MTHEQKQESPEFQAREEQIETMTVHHMEAGFPINAARKLANDGVAEAEARGAAEQRRKDAEEVEPVKWQRDNPGNGWIDTPVEDLPFYRERGFSIRPLYTRPANVAALIAEAVAAERERCAKVCETEAVLGVSSDPTDIAYIAAVSHCVAAIREGGEG